MDTQTRAAEADAPQMETTGHGVAERERPASSGDLTSMLESAPMFRRTVAGYDRFEVDTYVRWAEDELTTAEREHEHLMARHLETVSALDDARRLLDHSHDGREFIGTSQRIGTLLAAAADEAEGIRAEAQAERAAAAEAAARLSADAARTLTEAGDEAARRLTLAATEAGALLADARRVVEEAEHTATGLRTEAERYLAEARLTGRLAEEDADLLRRQAAEEVLAAHLQGRDDVVRMLATGREQRRRADEEAAAERTRLDDAAATRRAALLADVATLEARRDALRAEAHRSSAQATPGGWDWALRFTRRRSRTA